MAATPKSAGDELSPTERFMRELSALSGWDAAQYRSPPADASPLAGAVGDPPHPPPSFALPGGPPRADGGRGGDRSPAGGAHADFGLPGDVPLSALSISNAAFDDLFELRTPTASPFHVDAAELAALAGGRGSLPQNAPRMPSPAATGPDALADLYRSAANLPSPSSAASGNHSSADPLSPASARSPGLALSPTGNPLSPGQGLAPFPYQLPQGYTAVPVRMSDGWTGPVPAAQAPPGSMVIPPDVAGTFAGMGMGAVQYAAMSYADYAAGLNGGFAGNGFAEQAGMGGAYNNVGGGFADVSNLFGSGELTELSGRMAAEHLSGHMSGHLAGQLPGTVPRQHSRRPSGQHQRSRSGTLPATDIPPEMAQLSAMLAQDGGAGLSPTALGAEVTRLMAAAARAEPQAPLEQLLESLVNPAPAQHLGGGPLRPPSPYRSSTLPSFPYPGAASPSSAGSPEPSTYPRSRSRSRSPSSLSLPRNHSDPTFPLPGPHAITRQASDSLAVLMPNSVSRPASDSFPRPSRARPPDAFNPAGAPAPEAPFVLHRTITGEQGTLQLEISHVPSPGEDDDDGVWSPDDSGSDSYHGGDGGRARSVSMSEAALAGGWGGYEELLAIDPALFASPFGSQQAAQPGKPGRRNSAPPVPGTAQGQGGQPRHVCAECGKEFTRRYNLKGHERAHRGERPYACGVCGASFTRQNDLKRHGKTHAR